jgi:hypothetical protein
MDFIIAVGEGSSSTCDEASGDDGLEAAAAEAAFSS